MQLTKKEFYDLIVVTELRGMCNNVETYNKISLDVGKAYEGTDIFIKDYHYYSYLYCSPVTFECEITSCTFLGGWMSPVMVKKEQSSYQKGERISYTSSLVESSDHFWLKSSAIKAAKKYLWENYTKFYDEKEEFELVYNNQKNVKNVENPVR